VANKILSVGDVAFELEIHERDVREWAAENDIPAVGTEYMFSPADVKRLEESIDDEDEDDDDAPSAENPAGEDGDEDEDGNEDEDDDIDEEE
jgi:hypothetical protein